MGEPNWPLTKSVHPFKGDTVVTGEDSHMNTHSKKGPMTFNFRIQIKRPLSNPGDSNLSAPVAPPLARTDFLENEFHLV